MNNLDNKIYWNERENTSNGVSKFMRADINSLNEEMLFNIPCNEVNEFYVFEDSNLIVFQCGDVIYSNGNSQINTLFSETDMLTSCVDEENNFIYTFDENPYYLNQFYLIRLGI